VRKDGDFIDALIGIIDRIPPYSIRALMIAVTCLAIGAIARVVVGLAGSEQRFVAYYPGIMAAGLLAGIPAAIGVAVGATLIAWSAVIPPLIARQIHLLDLSIFLISSGCIIVFAHCSRLVLSRLKQSELQQVTLTNELIHRGRNTFAVLEGIVQNTLLHHPRLAKAILGRIRSISRANDLISAAAHSGVDLRDLLVQEFEPFGINRVEALGPDIRMPPAKVRHLILIFHELVTNSAKYGSLSNSSGRVAVDWTVVEDLITLNWKEKGGLLIAPPQREGFGTKLIAQSAESLSGKITQDFSFDGFSFSLAFRIPNDGTLFAKFAADADRVPRSSAASLREQQALPNIVRPVAPGRGANGDGMA
jgi:two-component sensor histidine kinase